MVIYHQNYKSPGDAITPTLNRKHILYIATRPGAIFNKEQTHGLFGKVEGMGVFGNIQDLPATVNMVRDLSKSGVVMHRAFISLAEEDAMQQGYTLREQWEGLLQKRIADIAEANNIQPSRMEWVASCHSKHGNPHCHIVFWDRSAEVQAAYIPPPLFEKRMERIRGRLMQSVFPDLMKGLFQKMDTEKESVKETAHHHIGDYEDALFDLTAKEYQRIQKKLAAISPDYAPPRVFNANFPEERLARIAQEVFQIKGMLPKKGRLNYAFMPEDARDALDRCAANIIQSNADCRSAMARYLQTVMEIRRLYAPSSESMENARREAEKEVLKAVANRILKTIPQLSKLEREAAANARQRQQMFDLLSDVFHWLSSMEQSSHARLELAKEHMRSELSKEARQELIKKLETGDSGWDYG
ncbi:relaxase MobL [Eubacteriales bacterium OttesenSCG-928-M02]|nr:relaxase MobL [Eubacteriales bacterium OttesenSCG-928-M02]